MLVTDKALKDVIFFSMDQTLRGLRAYSTKVFLESGFDITVDQWLVLKRVSEGNGTVSQTEIAEMLDKDAASMTRILDILVKKDLLFRKMSSQDRRRFDLVMTQKGIEYVTALTPIVLKLREQALAEISDKEIQLVRSILEKVTHNLSQE